MRITYLLCTAWASIVLTGCGSQTRSRYVSPDVALPAQFAHAGTAMESAPALQDPAWWNVFNDPQLNSWVELAIARNSNLATAAIRVRRAALEAQQANHALRPTPSLSLDGSSTQALSGGNRHLSKNFNANVGLRWELDLFDRLGAQRDAARFEAEASLEDLHAVALSLVSSVANVYWQLAMANERIRHAQHSLAHVQQLQALVALRYRSGADSRVALREAEQAVAEQYVELNQRLRTRAELRQMLMVLFDGMPPPIEAEPQRLPDGRLPAVLPGLPATLLSRRPDVRAAELRLRASLASSDAAAARLYPSLSLSGSLGTSSQALLGVLANPVATLGASLSLPFLNAREFRLAAEIEHSRFEEAQVEFRKTMYDALSEVEKALSAKAALKSEGEWLRKSRDESLEIAGTYALRYRAGQVPLRDWLDAQERLRSSELALASSRLGLLQNYLDLQKAMGGSIAGHPALAKSERTGL